MEVEDEKEVEEKVKKSKIRRGIIFFISYIILFAPVFLGIFIESLFVKIFSTLWLIFIMFGWNEERKIKEKFKNKFNKIKKEIDKDIGYQESLLTGNFEKDKLIKWRITGMKSLKRRCGLN